MYNNVANFFMITVCLLLLRPLPMLLVAFSIILLRTGVICASESSSNPAAEGVFISAFIDLMMVLRWSFSSTKRTILSKISKKSVMCPCLQSAAASSSFFSFSC